TEALKAQELAFQECSRIQTPIVIHQGGDDPVANPEASERFFQSLTVEDKSFKNWSKLKHEIFNEIEREQVFGDIEQWINKHCSA
ncbi:MAG: alpha/beta hydrolase, partial [Planctomycetota bacterium]|nr:alpha/beta hydrolase [Planctomycetota bacterium]